MVGSHGDVVAVGHLELSTVGARKGDDDGAAFIADLGDVHGMAARVMVVARIVKYI